MFFEFLYCVIAFFAGGRGRYGSDGGNSVNRYVAGGESNTLIHT